jgi:hypothetical protein
MQAPDQVQQDAERIRLLGGPTRVAEKLKLGKGGVQRVQNWLTRGIPASVKLEHPNLFLRKQKAVA